jgi:hypothetical protein
MLAHFHGLRHPRHLFEQELGRDPTHRLQHVTEAGADFQIACLDAAFCGVWVWAAENLKEVERARRKFDKLDGTDVPGTGP